VGGIEPMVGRKHVRIVAIDGYPLRSVPGILHVLDTLPMDYRWSSRAVLLDPEEARVRIEKTRRKWKSSVYSFIDKMRKTPTGAPNTDAIAMEKDCIDALGEAAEGHVQFAYFDSQLIFLHTERSTLDGAVNQAMKIIQNAGFACRLETINAVEAFLGS